MNPQEELISVANSVLLEHMRPTRKVQLRPHAYNRPSLPPPPGKAGTNSEWPKSFQVAIDSALDNVWADSTIKNYSHAVRTFLAFCSKHHIPQAQTFPASDYLVCAFISQQLQTVSQSTIKNYISGIRAWHIRNGYSFTRSDRLNLIARASRPLANRNPPRAPVTIEMLTALSKELNKDNPFDMCVFACATSAFWGLVRLGEFLPTSYSFNRDPAPFPMPTSITQGNLDSLKLHLPWTKVKKWAGEDIYLTIQESETDPVKALQRHLLVNQVQDKSILFSFKDHYGTSALLKHQFLARCNEIWAACGLSQTTGHSFRIGGTSHLLLCGVNPDIIKKTGRWSSDSFLHYWRNLDIVIPRHTTRIQKASSSGHLG